MPQPSENPYAAPYVAESIDTTEPKKSVDYWGIQSVARRVFIEWEKLRLYYNVVLVAACLVTAIFTQAYALVEFWIACFFAGIGANFCFFAGPVVETYLTWLRQQETKSIRLGLFLIGLIFSAVLAIIGTIIVAGTALLPAPQ